MPDLLDVQGLTAGYGEAVVLTGVTFKVAEGQALALLGRNGMGKTTLVNSIIGVTRHIGGTHQPRRPRYHRSAPRPARACRHRLGAAGAQHFPLADGRGEHDRGGAAGAVDARQGLCVFPRLAERRRNLGNQLSGGEQQMLAIGARADPQSAHHVARRAAGRAGADPIAELLAALRKIIREEGLSAILVEQNAQKILGVTDQAIIIERGSIVYQGESAALKADRALLETYVGVTDAGSVSRKAQREARSSTHSSANRNPEPQ